MLLLAPLTAAQEDQRPREPKKDDRGLLQINRQFYDLAAATGGDAYFWAPGEFGVSQLQIPLHGDDAVLLSYGTLGGAKTKFEIPVDTGVQRLTLFASMQRKDLAVLVRPDGTVARDKGVALQSYQNMLIATVAAPMAGTWFLEIDGAGLYAVTAHVKAAGDAPQLTHLKVSEDGRCESSISGSPKSAEIVFVAMDGSVVGTDCAIPKVPYRVMARGLDANGVRFQRVQSAIRKGARDEQP